MKGGGDEGPGRPGVGQRAEVGGVAHPAAGEQLDLRATGMELSHKRHVRSRAGADAREVEDDRLACAGVGEARKGVGRADVGRPRAGPAHAPGAQVEAEYERRIRQLGPEPPERRRAGQRLGADHDARDAQLEQPRDRRGRCDAGVDHRTSLPRQRGDERRAAGAARDRVEVRDVELFEAETRTHRARQAHGVGSVGDPAAQRAIAFALPAHGVHGGSALEIYDRDHSHDRGASRMRGVIGLDIGGANTKAVWRDGDALRAVSRPFEVWRDRAALTAVLRDAVGALAAEPVELVALTTTAELSDAFATKREGVAFVLDAAEAALGGRLLALTTAGELVSVAEARARPLDVAAANWMASALAVAARQRDALMLDVGSTTADVIPIVAGSVTATARTDLDRLLAGELVYTGVLRTNLAAVAPRVPVRGRWSPVASELFAISADVHLILGHLEPEAYTCPTPDGRAASVEAARARVGADEPRDAEQLDPAEVEAIAAYLHAAQVRQIEAAVRRVSARHASAPPIVPLGAGAFMARAVAGRLGRPVAEMPWSAAARDAAPAAALAELAATRLRLSC